MAGNNRDPSNGPSRLLDLLSKTDAIEIALELAREKGDVVSVLASVAETLSATVPAQKVAAKKLRRFDQQLKAGHSPKCFKPRHPDGHLWPGWRLGHGGWKCAPDCKANQAS